MRGSEEACREDGNLGIPHCVHSGQSAFASFYCCKSLSTVVTYLWLPDVAHLITCVYQVRLSPPGQDS